MVTENIKKKIHTCFVPDILVGSGNMATGDTETAECYNLARGAISR